MFLCTDLWKDAATLHAAYCDSQGVTEAFIKNGMVHALHALGVGSDPSCWQYDVVINPVDRRVEMWLVAEEDVLQVIEGVDISKGERVLMEMSRKFTLEDIRQLAFQSNFYVQVHAHPHLRPFPSLGLLLLGTEALVMTPCVTKCHATG